MCVSTSIDVVLKWAIKPGGDRTLVQGRKQISDSGVLSSERVKSVIDTTSSDEKAAAVEFAVQAV